MAGTFPYMAPEQLHGNPRPASDQYALGVIVYEWLCGVRPFQGSEWEIANQHLFVHPPPLREKIPSIPASVESVVLKALAKDPQERFASVLMFANELEQASQWEQPTIPTPLPAPWPLSPTEQSHVQSSPLPQTQKPELPFPQNPVHTTTQNHTMGAESMRVSSSQVTAIPMDNKEKGKKWRIGKREVVAGIVGSILSGILVSVNDYIVFSHQAQHTFPPNATINMIQVLRSLTILFFGAVFGPWVGLFTAEFGSIIAYLYTSNIATVYGVQLNWDFGLGGALIGFITGLATLIPQKGNHQMRTIAITECFGILGVIMGVGLYIVLESLVYHAVASPWSQFLATLKYYIAALILLPITLVAYNFFVRRRGSA
jgi:hypothetical protein